MVRELPRSRSIKTALLLSCAAFTLPLVRALPLNAQVALSASPPSITLESPDTFAAPESQPTLLTTHDKWRNFLSETGSPLTLGGGTFNAFFSQVTQTDPQYGKGGAALAQRFGASVADIVTQNFFGDFVVASALHEDPRYHRKGEGHSLLYRTGYAISRALVIRKDTGGNTFNFDNVLGSAMSSGFSNLYYPAASRTGGAFLMHFGTDIADNGFVNLAPEFWPDFSRKVLRRGRHHHS